MQVSIYSRADYESLFQEGLPSNTAVICFYDRNKGSMELPLHNNSYQVAMDGPALDEADALAFFVFYAKEAGLNIICVCETGMTTSAGCAAAIRQFFNGDGIDVFTNLHYFPDQQTYHEVFDALVEESFERGEVNCRIK